MYRYNKTNIILKASIASLLILAVILECSCERSEAPERISSGFITYTLCWDSAIPGFPIPEKIRYCIYPSEGGPMIQTDGDASGIKLALPPGTYDILVFNYDAHNVGFRGMREIEKAEAYLLSLGVDKTNVCEAMPLYTTTIYSVEVQANAESQQEIVLNPVSIQYKGALKLNENSRKIIDSIRTLQKVSVR